MEDTKEIFYGYVPSLIDGTENTIDDSTYDSLELPEKYNYLQFMSPVLDQGQESTCVPHSISASYDYYNGVSNPETASSSTGQFSHSRYSIHQVYDCRTNRGDGMSYKEALEFCKNHGVVSEEEYKRGTATETPLKIYDYARVVSPVGMKQSLLINGPVMIATLVKDPVSPMFWRGTQNYGGHATCLVGYDDTQEAFILRNSWGEQYGYKGYCWFPYKDYKDILEAWTILI